MKRDKSKITISSEDPASRSASSAEIFSAVRFLKDSILELWRNRILIEFLFHSLECKIISYFKIFSDILEILSVHINYNISAASGKKFILQN